MSCAVYRLFSKDGSLLYVGISDDPERRFGEHEASKDWWGDVKHRTVSWYDTRSIAEAVEVSAIQNEHPVHNKAYASVYSGILSACSEACMRPLHTYRLFAQDFQTKHGYKDARGNTLHRDPILWVDRDGTLCVATDAGEVFEPDTRILARCLNLLQKEVVEHMENVDRLVAFTQGLLCEYGVDLEQIEANEWARECDRNSDGRKRYEARKQRWIDLCDKHDVYMSNTSLQHICQGGMTPEQVFAQCKDGGFTHLPGIGPTNNEPLVRLYNSECKREMAQSEAA